MTLSGYFLPINDNKNMPDRIRPAFKKGPPRHFLREWRDYRNLTQEELAEMVGISHGAVSQIERGEVGFTQRSLEAFAKALSCKSGNLIDRNPIADTFEPIKLFERIPASRRNLAIQMLKTLANDATGTDG